MTFDEWFTERRKNTTFFKAGVCEHIAESAWNAATLAEREACRQECLQVLEESNNIAASVCAGRIAQRANAELTGRGTGPND